MNLIFTLDSLRQPLTGIGYYSLHLLQALLEDGEIDEIRGLLGPRLLDRADLVEIMDGAGRAALMDNPQDSRVNKSFRRVASRLPGLARLARDFRLARQSRKVRPLASHLLHSTNGILPSFPGSSVATVHDLSHIRHPETHPPERVRWLNDRLPESLSSASHILAVSAFTRDELLETGLVANPEKISVIYNGCEPEFRPRTENECQSTLDYFGLRYGRYILSIATLEPRKNLARLVEAYRDLPDGIAEEYPLVLTGATGWGDTRLEELVKAISPPHRIILTGYLNRGDLQQLLSGAALFAYLSLYEGFGLPALEAMASGVPTLTSNRGALAEVVGDSGYTVAPQQADEIGRGMVDLLCEPALISKYRDLGLKRATLFSWQRCARETMQAYHKALQ